MYICPHMQMVYTDTFTLVNKFIRVVYVVKFAYCSPIDVIYICKFDYKVNNILLSTHTILLSCYFHGDLADLF